MGHGSERMVQEVYAHFQHHRQRLEHVEYRLDRLTHDAQIVPYLPLIESYEALGTETPSAIREIVDRACALLDLSQKQLAARVLCTDEASLYNWLSGKTLPLDDALVRLAQLLAIISHVEADEMLLTWFDDEADDGRTPRALLTEDGGVEAAYGRLFECDPLGSKRPARTDSETEES